MHYAARAMLKILMGCRTQCLDYTFPRVRALFGNAQAFGQTIFIDIVSTKVLYVTKRLGSELTSPSLKAQKYTPIPTR